jgi:antitoxin component of MazEF toxin-antitoxin module
MIKNLTTIGNSLGIVIEKPILEMLGISRETKLEINTDGKRLIIEPIIEDRDEKIRQATLRVMKNHEKTLRKLAE